MPAGSIQVTAQVTDTGITPNITTGVSGLAVTTAGSHKQSGRKSVGTTEESIAIDSDLAINGYILLINRDATNFVQFGEATGVYGGNLAAGGVALYQPDAAVSSIFLKADTATCEVEFHFYEA